MSDEYFTYTKELVPEGRRVLALLRAVEVSDTRTPTEEIIAKAERFEAWLKEAEPLPPEPKSPKPKLVKSE